MFALLLLQVQAQQANCVTGRISFDAKRMFAIGASNTTLDVSTYDLTVDYGAQNVKRAANGISISLIKTAAGSGVGARISTTRYIQYAKITARMNAVDVPGVVTTFITMSPRKDEIDWEFVGNEQSSGQSNVFYKGILEFGIRSKKHTSGPTSVVRDYTIDWKSDSISWSINNELVRTYLRNSTEAVTSGTPAGERSFPSEASQIQIGVWDGGSSTSSSTSEWAGGKIPWGDRKELMAMYEYIDIQCYNDLNQPVTKWPLENNPDLREAPATQPTAGDGVREDKGDGVGNGGNEVGIVIPPVAGLPAQPSLPPGSGGQMAYLSFSTIAPIAFALMIQFVA